MMRARTTREYDAGHGDSDDLGDASDDDLDDASDDAISG